MGAIVEMLKRPQPVLWLESDDYCARLLAGGDAPWLDTTAFVAWQRKAVGLLKPDVAVLPVAAVAQAWLAAHGGLRESMAVKKRAVFPLRTLLADEDLRVHLVELARALRDGTSLPMVLVLPSPRNWAGIAYRQAHGEPVEIGEEEADSAAVYVADLLSAFGREETGVDALLLEEDESFAPVTATELACYQPVLNVAQHFRWDVGLHLRDASRFEGALSGYGFSIAPRPLAGSVSGISLPSSFWSGADAPSAPLRHARIPADAQPEAVLERLAALR